MEKRIHLIIFIIHFISIDSITTLIMVLIHLVLILPCKHGIPNLLDIVMCCSIQLCV